MGRFSCIFALLYFLLTGMMAHAAGGSETLKAKGDNVQPVVLLKPGEWYEVPNSRMAGLTPQPPPGGHSSTSGSIMSAWNGGAYDTKRDRLVIFGGGHADYGGNELYAFDVRKLAWQRLTNPSPTTLFCGPLNKVAGQTDSRWNGDGTPVSRHTYDGLQYIPTIDKFWASGGSDWCLGASDSLTWVFDFDALKWQRRADAPDTIGTPVSAYDPVTGHVFTLNHTTLFEYDPLRDSWQTRSSSVWQNGGNAAEIDPVRRRFIVIGSGDCFYYDLGESGTLSRKKLMTTGANEIMYSDAPGMVYDPVIDKIVAWSGAAMVYDPKTGQRVSSKIGANVYVLDLDTFVWTRHPAVGPVKPPSTIGDPPWGTFGRWQYIPSKDAFIGVNSVHTNVYFYKLPSNVKKTVK